MKFYDFINNKKEKQMAEKNGKVFLITGASTGIGAETARAAYKAGYKLALASRSIDKLSALADELGGKDNALAIKCDVTDWDSQKEMVKKTIYAFGKIDIVYVNAGFDGGSPFVGGEDTPDEWKEMVLTNVYGAAVTARLVLPELIKHKGQLLFTGSVIGRYAAPGRFYSSTKWAVTGMAESIRKQILGTGVRVTHIAPGKADTPFWKEKPSDPLLKPQDVAAAVIFAISQPDNVDVNEIVIRPVGQQI
jgi:NADP-dependent 3-hydroxy acid dehydrogenase YdfG